MNRGDLIAATFAGEQSPLPINGSSEVNSTTATKVAWKLEIKFSASHQPTVTSSIITSVTMTMKELQLQVQRLCVSS